MRHSRLITVPLLLSLLALVMGCGEPEVRSFDPGDGHAVCYGPHRDGQRPGGPDPSPDELREDVLLMTQHWKLLRTYGASSVADDLLTVIRDDGLDMKVVLGCWVSPHDDALNEREVEAAIRLANAYPDVVAAVCVGNETQIEWSAHLCPPDRLLASVRRVRDGVTVPVAVADDFNFWNKPRSLEVAAEIDLILMHAHPMWNGLQREDAMPWLLEQLAEVRALHERSVVIGETGWATSVHTEGEQARLIKGVPGEAEQKAFFDDLRAWAEAEGETVFLFEAFDENWKGGSHPAEVEKHWGAYRADRTPKEAVR